MLYRNCKAMWFFMDSEVGTQPCEVRFDRKEIVVAFHGTSEYDATTWRGKEQGKGHYHLRADDGYGEAALHQFEGGGFLDGYWEEEDREGVRGRGMIRIEMGETEKS